MTEYLNAYRNFNKLLSTENVDRITTTNDILKSLSIQLPDRVDSIKEEKLKTFRDTMSYVYEIFILNPYTIEEKTYCPFLSDELLFIHYRMLRFLLSGNFITMIHKPNGYKFNWNIPKPFMPILTAYILATNTSPKKFADANSFFDRFNSYILSDKRVVVNTKNASSQLTNSACEGWLIYELGKYYFCNLESFIHNVAVTPYKIRMVYQTLAPLTNTLLFNGNASGLVTYAVNALFLHFRKQYLSNENDSGLFDHIEPFTVSG